MPRPIGSLVLSAGYTKAISEMRGRERACQQLAGTPGSRQGGGCGYSPEHLGGVGQAGSSCGGVGKMGMALKQLKGANVEPEGLLAGVIHGRARKQWKWGGSLGVACPVCLSPHPQGLCPAEGCTRALSAVASGLLPTEP